MPSSWPNADFATPKRLELGYAQFLTLVLEIPSKSEYIDFGWVPDHLWIAETGGIRLARAVKPVGRVAPDPIIWAVMEQARRAWH